MSKADCSGFINRLIQKSYNLTDDDFKRWFGRARPYASTYYKIINQGIGFQKITNIHDTNNGDFIVLWFPPDVRIGDNTGSLKIYENACIFIYFNEAFLCFA